MAPRRPLLFPRQYALAVVTALLLLVGLTLVLWAYFG